MLHLGRMFIVPASRKYPGFAISLDGAEIFVNNYAIQVHLNRRNSHPGKPLPVTAHIATDTMIQV
jgi:hypothetical protein